MAFVGVLHALADLAADVKVEIVHDILVVHGTEVAIVEHAVRALGNIVTGRRRRHRTHRHRSSK